MSTLQELLEQSEAPNPDGLSPLERLEKKAEKPSRFGFGFGLGGDKVEVGAGIAAPGDEGPDAIGFGESLGRELGSQKPGSIVPGWVKKGLPVIGAAGGLLAGPGMAAVGGVSGAFVSGAIETAENMKIVNAMNRLTSNQYTNEQKRTQSYRGGPVGFVSDFAPEAPSRSADEKLVTDYFAWLEDADRRGTTTGGAIASGLTDLAPFMAEFAATGGLFKITNTTVRAAAERLIGKYGAKAAGGLAGVATQTTALPGQVAEKATERQAKASVGMREDEGWATSILKAWGSQYIETGTEYLGQTAFAPLQKKLGTILKKSAIGARVESALRDGWMAKTGKSASDFYTKIKTATGWSDMLGELGEEYVGNILHSALGTEDTGAGPDADMWQRIAVGQAEFLKTLPATLGVLAVPAIGFAGLRHFVSRSASPAPRTDDLTPQEAENLAQTMPEVAPWVRSFNAGLDQGMTPEQAAKHADNMMELRAESELEELTPEQRQEVSDTLAELEKEAQAAQEEPPTAAVEAKTQETQAAQPQAEENKPDQAVGPKMTEQEVYGQHLSDQELTPGVRNRVLGDVRKRIWDHPVVQGLVDTYQRLDEFLSFRAPKQIAADVREAVNSIFDEKVREAVKKNISYAKSKDEVVQGSPDEKIEILKEKGVELGSFNDLIDLMAFVEAGKQRRGSVPESIRQIIKKIGDVTAEFLIDYELKLQGSSFKTAGDADRYTMDYFGGYGMSPSDVSFELLSFQNLAEEKIQKIRDTRKRDAAIDRLAVEELAMEKRRDAEKAARKILEGEGLSEVVYTGEMPDKPDDDIPFEKREGKPVGAFYINDSGQSVIALALGADSRTGYHEAEHALETALQKKDLALLKKQVGDGEARARAFADYAVNRDSETRSAIRAIWDKLLNVIHRVRNGLRGLGFRTVEDIFGELYEGRYDLGESVPTRQAQFSTERSMFTKAELDAKKAEIRRRLERNRKRRRPLARPTGLQGDRRTMPLPFPEELAETPEGVEPREKEMAPGPSIHPPEWYDEQAKIMLESGKLKKVWQGIKDATGSAVDMAEYFGFPISDRLKRISPYLWAATRRYMFDTLTLVAERYDQLAPLLKNIRKLSKSDQKKLDIALLQRDAAQVKRITDKVPGMQETLDAARGVLDDIYDQAQSVGIDIGYLEDYWPRYPKDYKGLNRFFGREDFPILDQAIRDRFHNRAPTLEERANLLGELLRTGKIRKYLSRRQNTLLARKIKTLGGSLMPFYHDAGTSIMLYTHEMTARCVKAQFLGRVDPTQQGLRREQRAIRTRIARLALRMPKTQTPQTVDDYNERMFVLTSRLKRVEEKLKNFINLTPEKQIEAHVVRLIQEGVIDESQEREVYEMMLAILNPGHTHSILRGVMNVGYLSLLPNILTAMSNLKELAFAYNKDPRLATRAMFNVTLGKAQVSMREMGTTTVGEEWQPMNLYRLTRMAMGASFFRAMDLAASNVGSETSILQYQERAQDEAQRDKLMGELKVLFGTRAGQVYRDLKTKTITPDIRFLAFNSMSDIRPTSLLEEPEFAVKHGNLRILYMLRRVALRQLNHALREIREAPDLPTKVWRSIRMAFWISLFGAGIDLVRDILAGREPETVPMYVLDNIIAFVGMNRYNLGKIKTEGIRGPLQQFIPPTRIVDDMILDIADYDERGLRSIRNLPIVGSPYYYRVGRGAKLEKEREEKRQKKSGGVY